MLLSARAKTLDQIFKPIELFLPKVEAKILEILSTDNEFALEVIQYFFRSKGKFLRPALMLLGAGFGSKDLSGLVSLASAVEIFHSATLIHDDVIDSSFVRRNIPTINAKWNSQVAVLVGDFLHDRATKVVHETDDDRITSVFLNTASLVCDGEILEFKEKNNFNLKEKTYLTIIERKTASLLGACLEVGGIWAGLSTEQIEALRRYGTNFGMAFQIIDDCLDFKGKEHDFGKTLGADLHGGVLTLPLIRLISLLDEERKAEVFSKVKSGMGQTELGTIVRLLEEYGAIEYAFARAREFTEKAELELSIFPDSPSKQSLLAFLDYVIDRNR